MKIRTGFVTNSSSSSFVVVFDKVPESIEELQGMLFRDESTYCGTWGTFPTKEVAAEVWGDIQRSVPNDVENIISYMGGVGEGSPRYSDFRIKGEDNWDAYSAASLKHAEKVAEAFLEEHKGKFIFSFTYSDEGTGELESSMRCGGVFDNLPTIEC